LYLWDTNILRHFTEGHPKLQSRLQRVLWTEIALPSIVVAEVLRGRCDFALKATVAQAPQAHQLLLETQRLLGQFQVVAFDDACVQSMLQLQTKFKSRKRYADVMIAAIALSGRHIVVTRNQSHFADLLPVDQLVNWID
jgi:predicted nucleic acid-binding protein